MKAFTLAQLVAFRLESGEIVRGQVCRILPTPLAVDTKGRIVPTPDPPNCRAVNEHRHDDEIVYFPVHLAGAVRAATNAQLRRQKVRREIALCDGRAIPRVHYRRTTVIERYPPPSLGRGRLHITDEPECMTIGCSSRLTAFETARLMLNESRQRREVVLVALRAIPRLEADAFRRVYLSGPVTQTEAAQACGCARKTLMRRAERAATAVRDVLQLSGDLNVCDWFDHQRDLKRRRALARALLAAGMERAS